MPDLQPAFDALSAILRPYAEALDVQADSNSELYLQTRHIMKNGQPLFFASVQVRKRYVSFYLMPVYVQPRLLDGISDALRKRMQGKSCFNFTQPDPALFDELEALTEDGFAAYREQGYV